MSHEGSVTMAAGSGDDELPWTQSYDSLPDAGVSGDGKRVSGPRNGKAKVAGAE